MGLVAQEDRRRVETTAAEIEEEPGGLVVVRIKPGVDLVLERMREILDARFALVPRPAPVLVDARHCRSMSREAQELSAGAEASPYTARLAILMDGPVSVVLGNFFMVFVKPPYPTRLFRDETAAREWLGERAPA